MVKTVESAEVAIPGNGDGSDAESVDVPSKPTATSTLNPVNPATPRLARWAPALAGITAAILLALIHPSLVAHPDSWLLADKGDGLRTMSVIAAQVRHGTSWFHFELMNYPYGEHLVFCNGQPALSNPLRILESHLGTLPIVGVLNLFALVSFVVAAAACCRILILWGVRNWPAVIGGVGVAMMSPAVTRMPWYPGLGHAAVLPVTLWLMLEWERRPTTSRSIGISIWIGVWSLVHPYWAVIAGFLLVGFHGVSIFKDRYWKRRVVHAGLQLSYLVIVALIITGTDHAPDRSSGLPRPGRFAAAPISFFAHPDSPVTRTLARAGMIESAELIQWWEGWAYPGAAVIVFLAVAAIAWFRHRSRPSREILACCVVAVCAFIVATGVPLLLFSESDALPSVLRQFRAVGRFSWITTMMASLLAFRWCCSRTSRRSSIFAATAIVMAGSLVAEGLVIQRVAWRSHRSINILRPDSLALVDPDLSSLLQDFRSGRYQAIMPAPWFAIGHERFGWPNVNYTTAGRMVAVTAITGLPMTASFSSRLSVSQVLAQEQIFAADTVQREISSAWPDDRRPIAVVVDRIRSIPSGQAILLKQHARLVKRTASYDLLELEVSDMLEGPPRS